MRYLLWTPRNRGFRLWAGSRILAPAAIATLPEWMRRTGGFDQPAFVDAAVVPAARAFVRGLTLADSKPMLALARRLVPHTAEVLEAHLTAPPPVEARTITPAQARQHLALA
jgi:hypothetical protein